MSTPHDPTDRRPPADTEDRLRDAVHAYTSSVDPTPDAWARLRAAADAQARPRRVRLLVFGFAGAAVAAAAVTAGVLLTRDTAERGVKVVPPATEGGPTTGAPTTAVAVTPSGETGIVAGTTDGRVVLLYPDGTEVQTLVEATDGRQVTQVQLASDGRSLWYLSKPAGERYRCGDLYRAQLTGWNPVTLAEPEPITTATYFALSPDGERLAYIIRGGAAGEVGCLEDGAAAMANAVVVEVLATGDGVRFENEPNTDHAPDYPEWLAWSPDGSRLATALCWEGCAVAVLGPAAGMLEDAPRIEGNGETYFPVWESDSRLLAQEYCCFPNYTDGSRVAAFDPATGARVEELDSFGDTPFWGLWGAPGDGSYPDTLLLHYSDSSLLSWAPPAEPDLVVTDVLSAAWGPGLLPEPGETPGTSSPATAPTETTPPGTGTTVPPTETTAEAGGDCSAAELADVPWPPGAPTTAAWPLGMSDSVLDKIWAIHDAAVTCDWEALRSLMIDEFSYSFGGNLDADEAIVAWQEAEARGEETLKTLVQTVGDNFPTERDGYWIFGDADGLGYRAGFTAEGDWSYFVAGD